MKTRQAVSVSVIVAITTALFGLFTNNWSQAVDFGFVSFTTVWMCYLLERVK